MKGRKKRKGGRKEGRKEEKIAKLIYIMGRCRLTINRSNLVRL
jgi:hypothetical protein